MRVDYLLCIVFIVWTAHVTACSDDPVSTMDDVRLLTSSAAGGFAEEPIKKRWSGVQACSGQNRTAAGLDALDKTSAEATIDTFTKSATRVSVTGLTVGPTAEYTCAQVSLEGVVTDALDANSVRFDSASNDADRQTACTSSTGVSLIIGWLEGYDSNLTSIGGPWSLHFSVRTEQPVDKSGDASAAAFSDLRIKCTFNLELK